MLDFLQFDFNPIYLVWLFVALSAGLAVEAVYLTCYSAASYRSRINRRLMLSKESISRENVLIELRREPTWGPFYLSGGILVRSSPRRRGPSPRKILDSRVRGMSSREADVGE